MQQELKRLMLHCPALATTDITTVVPTDMVPLITVEAQVTTTLFPHKQVRQHLGPTLLMEPEFQEILLHPTLLIRQGLHLMLPI